MASFTGGMGVSFQADNHLPGALNIGDGGGKEEGRHLGCGLEKRPPCPRLTEPAGDAPPFRAGSFTAFNPRS
jgi:hypothetical protein